MTATLPRNITRCPVCGQPPDRRTPQATARVGRHARVDPDGQRCAEHTRTPAERAAETRRALASLAGQWGGSGE